MLLDRCDVQFETNVREKEMKQPTRVSLTPFKRSARYLAGTQTALVSTIVAKRQN